MWSVKYKDDKRIHFPFVATSVSCVLVLLCFLLLMCYSLQAVNFSKYNITENRVIESGANISQLLNLPGLWIQYAIKTGDKTSITKFDEYQNQVDSNVDNLVAYIHPDGALLNNAVRNVMSISNQIDKIESQMFSLIMQNKPAEANRLFSSDEYIKLKDMFVRNIRLISSMLEQNARANIHYQIKKEKFTFGIIFLTFSLSLFSFIATFKGIRQWQKDLDNAIALQDEYKQKLEASYTILEQKVEQRTAELNEKNNLLVSTMSNLRGLQQGRIQSEKMATIGQLSAGIAHEINNPLCFIMSNMNTLNKRMTLISELLAMYENLMAEVQKSNAGRYQAKLESITQFYQEKKIPAMIPDLQEIINESNNGLERIKHIVAHLGSFTAQSQDKMVSLDINASIESAIDMAWNQLKYKCTITKNFSELPLIAGNLEQLKMIFIAILLNAVQAVKEHGEISITTKKSDANIEVTITDNGCGIDPADLRKIFTPFFTTKPVGAGIGLGLSTVYAIVKAHGGSITVESELNKGSTFKIIFPVQKDS